MTAEQAYALAKKYVNESLLGGGAVAGKNVIISSIAPIDGGNRITFSYTLDNGKEETSTLDVMDGKDSAQGATEEQAQQIEENKEAIEDIREDLEEVFTSVSNGKEMIASAITDKGVKTDATETFSSMAQNIEKIETGSNYEFYEGDYGIVPKTIKQTMEVKEKIMKEDVTVSKIPYHEVGNQTGTTIVIGGII